jgi:hypothetical protein
MHLILKNLEFRLYSIYVRCAKTASTFSRLLVAPAFHEHFFVHVTPSESGLGPYRSPKNLFLDPVNGKETIRAATKRLMPILS